MKNKNEFERAFCDQLNKELHKDCKCIPYGIPHGKTDLRLHIKGTAAPLGKPYIIANITLHDKAIELTLRDDSLELLKRSFILEYYTDFTTQIATIINKHVQDKIAELAPLNAQIYCRKKNNVSNL